MQRVDVYLSSTVLNSCVLCTRTVKNRKFWVWTVVDFAVSVAVGVIAAAVVAIPIALFAITAPLSATIVVTAGVSIGVGYLVERAGFPDKVKFWLNNQLP
jgi:hypothetical protein